MISYAQAREDVLLHRALHHVPFEVGFYIDVGGYHPTHDSVTRHFYDHGWRGINIEPAETLFPAFPPERPRDINLQVAVSDYDGEVTFHAVEGQLGTLVDRFANRHEQAGFARNSYTVPCRTLTAICDDYAVGRDIHFLKIDIEGHEAAAIRGMDFRRYRPWVMVLEAAEPNNLAVTTHEEWEPTVLAAGYRLAFFDGLNRYYVADEHVDLLRYFIVPPDDYVYAYHLARIAELEQAVSTLQQVHFT